MGVNEAALIRLWQEKRGEAEPEDLSRNLIVQLGKATEQLNREWFQTATGQHVTDIQRHIRHPSLRWMGATLDGLVESSGAVFESKFMLPWSFSEEAAAQKYAPQLQHNMFVVAARTAVFQSSPAAASGLKSRPMPIRFTSISLSPRSGNSGVALKLASPHSVWRGSAKAADRGRTHCRYELIECVGRTGRGFHPNARSTSRTRSHQG